VQADSARTTRHFGGSGLGLVIARNMARLMRGDLTVTSRKGIGSTFVFAMPAVPALGLGPAAEAESMWCDVTRAERDAVCNVSTIAVVFEKTEK
jgi:hypothetical protein